MFDPKEQPLSESNCSCPRTKGEILACFPEHEMLPALIELGDYEFYPDLWNDILDYSLGYSFNGCAWVTRSGHVWTTGWAKHEQMLRVMGLELRDVESAGWHRVSALPNSGRSPRGHICNSASPQQKAFAKRNDVTLYEVCEGDSIITTPLIEKYEAWKLIKRTT